MKRYLALTAIFISLAVSASTQPAKTVAILGDSYSTFYGFIPDDQPSWYYPQIEAERSDVNNVRQTWWWKLISEGGFKLGINDSYSGATVSYYGYNDEDYTGRSFITRATRLGNPDIILVFGAINDSWTGVRMGEYRYENITRADLFTYRPALAKLFQTLQDHYPNVDIYFILSDELREELDESTITICRHFNIPCISLESIEKRAGHPTVKGMASIASQVLKHIK